MKEYAVYKGENLLIMGSADECAKHLKVDPSYIKWLTSPTAKRRLAKRVRPEKCVVGVRLDDNL